MSSKAPKTQTTTSAPWKAVQPYLTDLYAKGQNAQTIQAGQTMDGLDLTADRNAVQDAGVDSRLIAGQNIAGNNAFTLQSLNRGLDASNVGNNPYAQKAIQAAINPLVNNFERRVLPSINLNAIQNAGVGSSRQGIAEGLAASDLNNTIADTTSTMSNNMYQQGLDTEAKNIALSSGVYDNMLTNGRIQAEVGNELQNQEQANLNEILTKWNFNKDNQFDALAKYSALLGNSSGGTTTAPGTSTGGASGVLGGAASGAAVGNSIVPGGTGAAVGAGAGALFSIFG
jgi:hypothetical protein